MQLLVQKLREPKQILPEPQSEPEEPQQELEESESESSRPSLSIRNLSTLYDSNQMAHQNSASSGVFFKTSIRCFEQ